MKAYSVNPKTQELKEIDIEIQANTVYSFFNSILIDESMNLNQHIIYADANAISEQKIPFFLGGQIFLGDLLILGRQEFEDIEVTIPKNELELLINYEVNTFYTQVLTLLSHSDINLYRTFEVQKKDEVIELNLEWVLYTFNIADERTRIYFIDELKKTISNQDSVSVYIQKMASLALNAMN